MGSQANGGIVCGEVAPMEHDDAFHQAAIDNVGAVVSSIYPHLLLHSDPWFPHI